MQDIALQLKERSPQFLGNMLSYLKRKQVEFTYDPLTQAISILHIPPSSKEQVLNRLIDE
jgi:hypothetical protein